MLPLRVQKLLLLRAGVCIVLVRRWFGVGGSLMYGATFAYPSLLPPQVGRGGKEAGIHGLAATNNGFFPPLRVRWRCVGIFSRL